MTFYVDPAFFILLAIAAIPAVVLGMRERPMRRYGFAVSVVFLVLLFSRTLEGLAAFGFFLVWATALTFWAQRLFKEENAHAVQLYRIALALAILPLAVYKVGAVFDQNLLGFLGISYITFKSVQVLIEIRDGLIENTSLFQYLYFLIFFPVFTSGPIMRSRDFCADIDVAPKRDEYLDGLSHGALWFLQGAVYKFVLAAFFSWLEWFAPQAIGTASAGATALGELAIALCYGLYLFFDFAGYSLWPWAPVPCSASRCRVTSARRFAPLPSRTSGIAGISRCRSGCATSCSCASRAPRSSASGSNRA